MLAGPFVMQNESVLSVEARRKVTIETNGRRLRITCKEEIDVP